MRKGLSYHNRRSSVAQGASLSLNFVNDQTLDPRITFTRASTATYFNSAGTLSTAAINTARFDYNPSTLAAQGLLIEEQRTNSLTYSEQFDNAAWTKQSTVSVAANTTVAPDGTTTGDTVTADSGLGVYQQLVSTISTNYCQSVFVKAGTATSIMFRDDTGAGRHIVFNPSTGVITATSGTLLTSGSQNCGNGWWRYWFAYAADTTAIRGIIRPNSAGSAQTFIVWGAQTEVGAFPTSYIPTTTAAATRSADVASMTGTNFSSWYNASEGTLFTEVALAGLSSTANQNAVQISDGTSANRIAIYRQSAGLGTALSFGSTINGSAWTTTAVRKLALGNQSGNSALAENGTITGTGTGTTAQTVNQLRLGSNHDGTGGFTNGYLRRITYYPVRLSNASLQALTA